MKSGRSTEVRKSAVSPNNTQSAKKGMWGTMSKKEFIKVFELTLVSANLDIISLSLIDNDHVLITFKGNGTRKVNIEGDSYGAIIQDTMKYVF